MGWLGEPDLVILKPGREGMREGKGEAIAVMVVLPGQYFQGGVEYDEEEEGEGEGEGGKEGGPMRVRPLGAAAFRWRVLKREWRRGGVVVVTPESWRAFLGRKGEEGQERGESVGQGRMTRA
eukprot:evm.model.NODE_52702_length_14480_cov_24.174585.1